jgi:hypothetical protein
VLNKNTWYEGSAFRECIWDGVWVKIDVWSRNMGIGWGWKETDVIHGRLCKKILGVSRFAADEVAELELGRDSWIVCYEWQVNNSESDSWVKKLRKQLSKIGLGYIWQDLRVNTVNGICKKIKERCNDIEWQNLFANTKEKRSLIFYSEKKQEWATE